MCLAIKSIQFLYLNQPSEEYLVGYLADGQVRVLYIKMEWAITTLCKRGWGLGVGGGLSRSIQFLHLK
jgi:hypothetical protein